MLDDQNDTASFNGTLYNFNWNVTLPSSTDVSYNCSFVDIKKLVPLSTPYTTQNFIITNNKMTKAWNNLINHYKVRVRFLLVKVDDWQTDYLDLYLKCINNSQLETKVEVIFVAIKILTI
jgi:hypothetical protein